MPDNALGRDRIRHGGENDIHFIEDMKRLELRPDDILVLRTQSYIDEKIAERMRSTMENKFPGHTVLILGEGLELGVLSPKVGDPR